MDESATQGYAAMENAGSAWFHDSKARPVTVHGGKLEDCEECALPLSELPSLLPIEAMIVHRDELLDRAAALVDPDGPGGTHEERLDWLAKWREVVGR